MNKADYLKLAIKNNKFYDKKWLISVIALCRPISKDLDSYEPLTIIPENWGYSVVMDADSTESLTGPSDTQDEQAGKKAKIKVKIEDADKDRPLFAVKDRFIIDSTWFPNVFEPIEVPFGNILFNAICIVPAFEDRFPFPKGKFSYSDIEAKIAPMLKDTPAEGEKRVPGSVYCDELVRMQDSREHFKSIAHLLNQSATVKTITKSPELEAYKKKLEKEYEGQLSDPVKLVEFEKKLQDFDNAWLKGDPADTTFLQGKVRNVARKKMHLSIGSEPGFETKPTVLAITKSLDQGWPESPEAHVANINGIRHGSLSRGKETIKGGVFAKYLLRAGNNFAITNTDCGARNGLKVRYESKFISRLVGRNIIVNPSGETKKISTKEEAEQYQGKYVILRSPAYCRATGDKICKVCAGDGLALNPSGVSIALTEMSSLVMTDFMKAMHDTTIKTAKLELDDIFS